MGLIVRYGTPMPAQEWPEVRALREMPVRSCYGLPEPTPEQAAAAERLRATVDAAALKATREELEREERAAMDYLGVVRLDDLLCGAATTVESFRREIDNYYCNRGRLPSAVIATPWQVSDLARDAGVYHYELQTPREAFEKGQRHEAIPGHRLVAIVCGVPLYVPEAT